MTEETKPVEQDDIHNEDFQFVLKELLNAYRPILEEDLKRAKAPEQLKKEAEEKPPSCDDELELANRIFETFFTEEVAVRLLPVEGRELMGPIERWRWCLLHIRCCIIFGWLVCRGPRTFRAFVYYLYRYWICVRQALGTPVSSPLTAEERQDFQILVQALAGAYKPYLTDQLASVEFPGGIPDEVLAGKIDCLEGEEEAAAIFERFLTTDTAPALLGKAAFEAHSKEPFFWFCRCWCLCAIRFGCCLARARNFVDVLHCLRFYRRCLRECFRPLHCELTAPTDCAEEQQGLVAGAVALEIKGTAAGAFFHHYTLEWRKVQGQLCEDDAGWSGLGVVYPGGGSVPVVNGTLGWLDTTNLLADSYEIRVCVYSTLANAPRVCCCTQFALFKVLVWIDRVADLPGAPVKSPPGWFDQPASPQAPIVDPATQAVVPVGGCISVIGSAWVGDCQNRRVACVDLRAAIDWQPGTAEPGFVPSLPLYTIPMLLAPICYTDPDPIIEAKKRAPWNQLLERPLTARWVPTNIPPFDTQYCLPRYCFDSANLLPPCPNAQHSCRSGKYTLLLHVTDTQGHDYYDTQQVWFDNKPIHVEFGGLEGLAACSDLCLGKFIPPGAPCGGPWPINLLGIAYDEFIDNAIMASPSDNFDFYSLTITRQGGPSYSIPITPSLAPPIFGPDPLKGTSRVGDPGTRCEQAIAGCPPPAIPPKFYGLLTKLDLRIFDAACVSGGFLAAPFTPPAGFALNRDECCGYTFQLYAQDKTWSDGFAGGFHHKWSLPWAVCICNELECPEEKK